MIFFVDIDDLGVAMEQGELICSVSSDGAPRGSVEVLDVKVHDQKEKFVIECLSRKYSRGIVPKKHFYDAIYDRKAAVPFWMRSAK